MYLGLDLGTTNVKAIVVDDSGAIVGEGSAPAERYFVGSGGVEQDIEQIWRATCKAISTATGCVDASNIRSVGVSAQGGAMQLLNADDLPLGRVISWLDTRGGDYDAQVTEDLGASFLQAHIGFASTAMPVGNILRLRDESPEMMESVSSVAFVGDVIVGRLCGRRAHDRTSLSICMLYNPWTDMPEEAVLRRIGISAGQLPDVIDATEAAGEITPQAASLTGLPEGIPVSPAVHDQYASSLGAGAVNVGDVVLGTGTAWVLLANGSELQMPVAQRALVCRHPVSGLFSQLLSMSNGGSNLEWALKMTGLGDMSGDEIDAVLASVPAGAEGLRFTPPVLPAGGGGDLPGSLEGILLASTREHLVRAVLDGLVCELARYLKMFSDGGIVPTRLVMAGRAAGSSVTPQAVADVIGLSVVCSGKSEGSAAGAAVIARALVDTQSSLAEIATQFASVGRTLQPGEDREVYRLLFDEYMMRFDA